ncbi:MAG TPA: rhodanese-like domain-containing protein [Puia sp.]|jgi:hypothetical protein
MASFKSLSVFLFFTSLCVLAFSVTGFRQKTHTEPWTEDQLLAPEDLARTINDPNAKQPVILCVGPGAMIKGSLDMGPAHEKAGYEKLKDQLEKLPKNADIVIYCGCCPFDHCPNIRPAFALLNEMKFNNQRLLNIRHNIKTDWIDKGFPVYK